MDIIDPKKERVYVFVDAANYHYGLGWQIDYRRFAESYKGKYDVKGIYYYEGIHSKKSFHDQRAGRTDEEFLTHRAKKLAFFKKLRLVGFSVRTKPINSVYDRTIAQFVLKCNFDVELAVDALDQIGMYDTAILCSGDGDFTKLVRYLKGKGKRVIVVAPSDRFSTTLREAASSTDSPHLHRKEWERAVQKGTPVSE